MSISNIITVVIAVFGWFVGYISSARLNLNNKKKEIRLDYLIKAYHTLSDCCNRETLSPEIKKAVADIQLFGTEKQLFLTQSFLIQLTDSHLALCDELLLDLRDELRKELKLSSTTYPVKYLRVSTKSNLAGIRQR